MAEKVSFDGENKLILELDPIGTSNFLDIKVDVYSAYKRWLLESDNSKYELAFRVIGGDEISDPLYVTPTFFLLNGWRIKPHESDHILTVIRDLYVEEGGNPFLKTNSAYNIYINYTTSHILNSPALLESDKTEIIEGVLDGLTPILRNMLGLMQHNFRFTEQIYNNDGNLTNAKIRIYNNSNDCENQINPINEYTVEAVYSGTKLIDYKVTENA